MSRRYKKLLVYLIILILPFFLLFAQRFVFIPFKLKVVQGSFFPLRMVSTIILETKKAIYYRKTYAKYKNLQLEVNTLRARLIGQEEVIRENSRLKKLLNFKRRLLFSSVAANVIGRDPSLWNASIIIDKGIKHGFKQGMPVVNELGVIGKLVEVGQNISKVMLLNDPNFSVAALVQRSREDGLVSGTLQGFCRMRYLSSEADIKIGDHVITSKISSSFPEGLLIGKVVRVQRSESSPTIECLIQPAVHLSQIEEVIVILK